jgi:hypothetical protein
MRRTIREVNASRLEMNMSDEIKVLKPLLKENGGQRLFDSRLATGRRIPSKNLTIRTQKKRNPCQGHGKGSKKGSNL